MNANDLLMGHELGQRLVPLLGLPEHTVWFELRCAPNEFVKIRCEYAPMIDKSFDTVMAEYCLARTDASATDTTPGTRHFDDWMRERTNAAHAAYMERIACLPN
jgi:hypothetical protein